MDNAINFSVAHYVGPMIRGAIIGGGTGSLLGTVATIPKSEIRDKSKFGHYKRIYDRDELTKNQLTGAGIGALAGVGIGGIRTAILRNKLKKNGYNPDTTVAKRDDGKEIYEIDSLGAPLGLRSTSSNLRLAARDNNLPRRALLSLAGYDLTGIPLHKEINVVHTDPRSVGYNREKYNTIKLHELGHANDSSIDKAIALQNSEDPYERRLGRTIHARDRINQERFADKYALSHGAKKEVLRSSLEELYDKQRALDTFGLSKLPILKEHYKKLNQIADRGYRGDSLYENYDKSIEATRDPSIGNNVKYHVIETARKLPSVLM